MTINVKHHTQAPVGENFSNERKDKRWDNEISKVNKSERKKIKISRGK